MGAEAKLYLQEHRIPQLFEGLMTGLIYNRPPDPISFLEQSLYHIKTHPDDELTWDMFIEKGMTSSDRKSIASKRVTRPVSKDPKSPETVENRRVSRESREKTGSSGMGLVRTPSVTKAAQVADIPHVPIILFMGGPGGGKTRHAAKVASSLSEQGLIHICMPDIIRQALTRYKDKYPEWREANEHYARGELIPNHLALALVKAEMGRHKNATAFFLEGFPREARQVEDFERQVKNVNMALIIDYDEKTLRDHMEKRGLGMEIIDQKIKEFKQKTLPSAKYFDDQKLLHLIPGERDDHTIYERMRGLVTKAMETGVPVINSNPPSQQTQRPENPPSEAVTVTNQSQSEPKTNTDGPPMQASDPESVPVVNSVLSTEHPKPEVSLRENISVSGTVSHAPVFVSQSETTTSPVPLTVESSLLVEKPQSNLDPKRNSPSDIAITYQTSSCFEEILSELDTERVTHSETVLNRGPQPVPTSPLAAIGTVQLHETGSPLESATVQSGSDRQESAVAATDRQSEMFTVPAKKNLNLSKEESRPGAPVNVNHPSISATNPSTNQPKPSGPNCVAIVPSMSAPVSSSVQLEKPRTPPVAVPAPPLPPSIPVRESTPTKIIGAEEPVFEVPPIPTIVPLPEIPSEVRVTPPTAEPSNTIVTTATIHNSRPTSQHRKSTAEGQRAATPKRNATPKDPPRTTSSQYNTAEVPSGLPNNAPVVLLVGAPGALKNDVAKLITQKYDGFVLISMGELLRKTVNESPDDELWNRINTKILEGEPVPTKLCRQLLYNEIHTVGQGAWGYVVEGYPRTISQLDDFEGVVARVDVAILIDCTEQFCEEMVKKRFEKSGHRKDDSPEVFKVRLAAFKQNTLPMLKHLDERGKLRVVDGDGDADTVFKEVSQVIDAALFIEEDDGSGGSLDESKKSLRTQQQQQQAV